MYNCFCDFATALLADDDDDVDDDGFRFRIVVVFIRQAVAVGVIYSSATGTWSDEATATLDAKVGPVGFNPIRPPVHDWDKPGAVVGDAVYWLLKDNRILSLNTNAEHQASIRTSDGMLGLVAAMESRLHLWTMETDAQGWMLRKTVQLTPLLPRPPRLLSTLLGKACPKMIGCDEEGTAVFLKREDGIFMLRLESTQPQQVNKICDGDQNLNAVLKF
ncbi:hypothetical protein PR202_ga08072 [Eleusine coracana subsp. coracana]|uniref:Uncharacterized protein n=1 Tax=Eleusine coracana subsp. coracana TaxID=191504 RepID=A0AAV5C0C9_ELECO|nr:hypothetical protein PR202_ga08072 [Eleusine coracana subsp. coracana]